MNMIDAMNYRYNNPDVSLSVDTYIVEAFIGKERTKDQIDQMKLWSSMSKENVVLEQMLQNAKEINLQQEVKTM